MLASLHAQIPDANPLRFKKAINAFLEADKQSAPKLGGIVIVGSSSVKRMKEKILFPEIPMLNRGFGGSQISDLNFYIEQTVLKHEPAKLVFFCGNNDLWAGHTVAEVREDFLEFTVALFERVPNCELIVLAVRPSPKRIRIIDKELEMNEVFARIAKRDKRITFLRGSCDRFLDKDGVPIPSLYVKDMLHMNEAGYAVWKEILTPLLKAGVE